MTMQPVSKTDLRQNVKCCILPQYSAETAARTLRRIRFWCENIICKGEKGAY